MNARELFDCLETMTLEQVLAVAVLQGHDIHDPDHGICRDEHEADDGVYWRTVVFRHWQARQPRVDERPMRAPRKR